MSTNDVGPLPWTQTHLQVLDPLAGWKPLRQPGVGLIGEAYDYISLGYTGSDLTSVVYRQGGAGGTVVATLTLAYSGGVLQSVTRT